MLMFLRRVGLTLPVLLLPYASAAMAQGLGEFICADNAPLSCTLDEQIVGDWTISTEIANRGTGQLKRLRTDSTNVVPAMFGRSARAALNIVCQDNSTRIGITFRGNFMSDAEGYAEIVFRIDGNEVQSLTMSASPDNQTLFVQRGLPSIEFIRNLFTAEKLYVAATSFTGDYLLAEFSVQGLQDVVHPLRDACNW